MNSIKVGTGQLGVWHRNRHQHPAYGHKNFFPTMPKAIWAADNVMSWTVLNLFLVDCVCNVQVA